MTSLSANSVRISVPASSANLGPGFDCLALALELRLTAEVRWSPESVKLADYSSPLDWWQRSVRPYREFTGTLSDFDESTGHKPNLLAVAFFKAIINGGPEYHLPARLQVRMHSDIPIGHGLGSSAAAVVAGAAIAKLWRRGDFRRERVLAAAVAIEGHADNAAAAVFGGLQAAIMTRGEIRARALPWHDSLRVALCVPRNVLKASTHATRVLLPTQLSRTDAVANQRALLTLLHGLETADGDAIAAGLEDRLHVPHRKSMIPGFEDILRAAREAGAFGATISGAGGAMIALGVGDMTRVADAMAAAYAAHGTEATPLTPAIAYTGLTREDA